MIRLDFEDVLDFLNSLRYKENYNIHWGNMFYDGYADEYEEKEWFRLGQRLADLFIWKGRDIVEVCEEICEELEEEERYGYFSSEQTEKWKKRVGKQEI